MKVSELYDKYTQSSDPIKVLKDNVSVAGDVAADDVIGTIRRIRSECMADVEGVSTIDYSLLEIMSLIGKVAVLTDIDMGEDVHSYNMVYEMDILGYVRSVNSVAVDMFEIFETTEERNYNASTSVQTSVKRNMETIAKSVGAFVTTIVNAVESFDPAQIEAAKDIMNKFNDGVVELQKTIGD